MLNDPDHLCPATLDGIAETLSFALRYEGRPRVQHADDKAPVGWVVVAASVPIAFLAMVGDMYRAMSADLRVAMREARSRRLPKIIRTYPNSVPPLLLVESSQLLGQGVAVSIYGLVNEFEVLLGEGHVQVVQQNTLIQVAVMMTFHRSG